MSLYVKICGLNTMEGLQAAIDAGADGLGLVLCPSPRQVGFGLAKRLFECIPSGVERIAVMDRPSPSILRLLRALPWDGIQLDRPFLSELAREFATDSCFLLPSYRDASDLMPRLKQALGRTKQGPELAHPSNASSRRSLRGAFLLDGPAGGGRGLSPDMQRAGRAARLGPMLLAGGLSAENVAAAIARVRPFGVDVSSGVESEPGHKPPALIQAYLRAARLAAAQLSSIGVPLS